MNIVRMLATLGVLAATIAGCSAPPPNAAPPRVSVEHVAATWVEADRQVRGYGRAMPAFDGTSSISRAIDGQVTGVLVAVGDRVVKGQALALFQRSAAARSALLQARASVTAARKEQARVARLLADRLVSGDQQDQAEKRLADAVAAYQAALADGGRQGDGVLAAPFDGVVAAVAVSPGARVPAGTSMLMVSRRDASVVHCGLEPADALRVVVGQPARLMPIRGGQTLQGTVARISNVIDESTRLVDVDIRVPQPLMMGLDYRADIVTGKVGGWRVPAAAVQEDDHGVYLFQIKGGVAVKVAVRRLLPLDRAQWLVAGPLDPQRPVVTSGSYQLAEGMLVHDASAGAAAGAAQ